MIDLLQTKNDFAACQPKILAYKNKNVFEYAGAAGGWLDAFGYPFARGRIFDVCEQDSGQYDDTSEIFWASGAAMLIRAEVFHQLNGFDEYFFAHQEEIDLCWRMQLEGYKIFCCPQSVVYHVGGGTLPRGNSKKTFLNFRNNHIMLAKNLHRSERWWKIPFRIFLDILSALKGLFSGDGGYFISIIKAHFAFLYWLGIKNKNQYTKQKKSFLLKGVYQGNVVWQHFMKKKSRFSQIIVPDKFRT
jgi:GT2 family glycosyltransferase